MSCPAILLFLPGTYVFKLSFMLQEYVVVGDADTDALSHIFKTMCVSFLAVLVLDCRGH